MNSDIDRVTVVAVGSVDDWILDEAAEAVEHHLGIPATVERTAVAAETLPASAHRTDLDQYEALAVARAGFEGTNAPHTLAVTDLDIVHEQANYVFGIAELDGRMATLSTARLGTTPHTEPGDEQLRDRVRKQALMQAGRLAGADECDDYDCVFSFSPTVRELDRKGASPCDDCRRALPDVGADREPVSRPGTDRDGEGGRSEGGGKEPERVNVLTHDFFNTGRYVGMLAGAGLSFVVAVQIASPVVELVADSWSDLSGQAFWVALVATLGVTYLVYRLLKWALFGFALGAFGAARSRAEEYLRDTR